MGAGRGNARLGIASACLLVLLAFAGSGASVATAAECPN